MYTLKIILIAVSIASTKAQGVGKVFIGVLPGNITTSLSYTQNLGGTTVPVYIENRDPTDASVVPIIGNVRVECELSITGTAGFSQATFTGPLTLSEANRGGNVPFTIVSAGQKVDVRCFGTSQSSIQFNKTESISPPSSFRIVSAPTVSICPTGTKDYVAINRQGTAQNITVRLSDQVVNSPVTVECIVGTGPLTFQTATVPVGAREALLTVTMTGAGPARASCRGQSATGNQYLRANSQGPQIAFQLLQPELTLYPSSLSISSTSFALILLLTSAPAGPSTFRCQADLLPLADVANALQNPLCRNPVVTPTADGIVTPAWGVLPPDISLNANLHHALLKVARNIPVTSDAEENVVVSCCSTAGTTLETAVWAKVSLEVNKTVNWEISTDTNNFTTPRTIQNVAFVEVAPCPCDLNQGMCDINCCCDGDCTTADRLTFSQCIPYLEGGQPAALPEYMCKSDHFAKQDWFHLMCVTTEYNSLLGFFYSTETSLRTTQALNQKAPDNLGFTYKETELRIQPPVPQTSTGYQQNGKVLSVKTTAAGNPERRGVVSLPQRILSGECLTSAPVQYLKDIDNDCSFEMTNQMCSDNSVFNALTYMQSSTTRDPSCPSSFSVMGNPDSNAQNLAETVVNYYCVTDATPYIKSTITVSPTSTQNLFGYTYPAGCALDVCNRETDTNPPCTGYDDSTQQEVLPGRCNFNNQYTRPQPPTINGGTCENAVVDVRYNFYWAGPSILKLNASVFLANIPLSTQISPVVVTQKYKAAFLHSFTGTPSATLDNFYNVETSFSRSGKPGYEIDKPMISGMVIRNESNNAFLYVNSNSSRRMAVWDTGFDGLCSTAGRREIAFGRDTLSSCNIYIGTADLQNCTDLSKLIINRLDNYLMPADRIGRYGSNNPYGLLQWIEVMREDLTPTCTNSLQATNETVLSWRFSGFCTDIISGVNLDVMYGESGKAGGAPINEIIGASISYTKSTWRLACGSGFTTRCSDPSYVEPFQITAAVRFIKVPANTPEPKIRWKEEHPDICYQDVCWENFMYPLERAYTAEPRQYVLAMVLVLILFIIGFLFITLPWW